MIVGLPLSLAIFIIIIRLLHSDRNNTKITVNLRACTVIRNGLKIIAVYDRLDPTGTGLQLYYDSHPSLEGRYIVLPTGLTVFAYIYIGDVVAHAPPLDIIEDMVRDLGSFELYLRFNRLNGSAPFP